MPKLAFRIGVGEVENYPDLPYKKRSSVRTGNTVEPSGFFDPNPWYDEQGFDQDERAYVEKIEVTEFDDGSLVAYLTKIEHEFAPDGKRKVKAYLDQEPGKWTRTYVTHRPVTSIELLLDQLAREEVSA